MEYKKEYEKWCANPLFDEKTRAPIWYSHNGVIKSRIN